MYTCINCSSSGLAPTAACCDSAAMSMAMWSQPSEEQSTEAMPAQLARSDCIFCSTPRLRPAGSRKHSRQHEHQQSWRRILTRSQLWIEPSIKGREYPTRLGDRVLQFSSAVIHLLAAGCRLAIQERHVLRKRQLYVKTLTLDLTYNL